ncbi:MAG: outer membrane beta-barrel protein [Gemmataceae bacterium]
MLPFLCLCTALPFGQTPGAEAPTPAAIASDRWLLMQSLQGTYAGCLLDSNRIQVSGWTEGSFTASTARNQQLPMGFNYRANEFLLQQNWLRFDRTVVTSGTSEPTWGFRFDNILPGSDYRFTLARGIFNEQLTSRHGQPNTYGIDPIQFYGEAFNPTVAQGLDVKVGRFFALYGVETNDAVSNALCSHAYTFIYDPFTHTGIVSTLKLSNSWTVQAGLVLGSDVFIDPADEPTFISTIKWTSSDQRAGVLLSAIAGSGRFNQARAFNNPEILDVVYTYKINRQLNYSFESLLGYTTHVTDLGTAWWFGVLNYLTYDFTPRLSATTRLELFDDEQGQRTGFPGLYTALTAGLSFRPWKSIVFRPEVRFDYNGESRPYENKHGLFTATADLILRW